MRKSSRYAMQNLSRPTSNFMTSRLKVAGAFLNRMGMYFTLYLVFGVSFPLSAVVVIKFGPMHIPIATKGYKNLFVALANHKRVDAPYAVLKVALGVLQKWNI